MTAITRTAALSSSQPKTFVTSVFVNTLTGTDTVTITVPEGAYTRLFGRLKVAQP